MRCAMKSRKTITPGLLLGQTRLSLDIQPEISTVITVISNANDFCQAEINWQWKSNSDIKMIERFPRMASKGMKYQH